MQPQRRVQFKSESFLPLLTFTPSQNNTPSYQLHSCGINLLQSIQSPVHIIATTGLSNSLLLQNIQNQIIGFQLGETCTNELNEFEGLWISREVRKIEHQQCGDLEFLMIGGNLSGDSKDSVRIQAISQIASLVIFNEVDELGEERLESLTKNAGLVEKVPSIWITKKQEETFEEFVKQDRLKQLREGIGKGSGWTQVLEVSNQGEPQSIMKLLRNLGDKQQVLKRPLKGKQLIDLLTPPNTPSTDNSELQQKLKQNLDKIKQLQQRYQSTKKYIQIVKNQYQDELIQQKNRYQEEISMWKKKVSAHENRSPARRNSDQDKQIESLMLVNKEIESKNILLMEEVSVLKEKGREMELKLVNTQQSKIGDTPLSQLENRYCKLEEEMRLKDTSIESLKTKVKELSKQLSLITQKQELCRMELEDIRDKYREAKQSEAKALDMLDINPGDCSTSFIVPQDDETSQIGEITRHYQHKLKLMESEMKKVSQINNKLELAMQLQTQKHTNQIKSLQDDLNTYKKKLSQQQSNNAQKLESSVAKTQELKDSYQQKIAQLERQLEQIKDSTQMSILQSKDSSEADVMVIKSYYQQQSILKEKKLHDERAKLEEKFKRRIDEVQERHREEMDELIEKGQEEVGNLFEQNEQMAGVIRTLESDQVSKLNEINSLNQKISHLNSTHISQVASMEEESKRVVEQLKSHVSILQGKYEGFRESSIHNQAKVVSLEKEIERKTIQFNELSSQSEQSSNQAKTLRAALLKSQEQSKRLSGTISELTSSHKIQIDKIEILSSQYKQYSQNKILELESLLSQTKSNSQKERQELKKDMSSNNLSEVEAVRRERDTVKVNYEELVNSYKAKEIELMRKVGEVEKSASSLKEKASGLQRELEERNRELEKSKETSSARINELRESLVKVESELKFKCELSESKIKQLEGEKTLLGYQISKTKALFEDRITHLQSQRKSQKQQYQQKTKRFSDTIQFLQTKQKTDNTHQILTKIQSQYTHQLKTLSQSKLIQQLKHQQTIKLLTLQLQSQKQKNIKLQHKLPSTSILGVSNKPDRSYQLQLQKLRQQKQSAIASHQQSYFSEKQTLRSKIKTLQQKMFEIEKGRSFMLFEQEKSQAKWNIEKQHLKQSIKDLQQTLDSLRQAKSKLQRQNQTMKVQRKKYKNLNMSMSMNMNSNLKSSMLGSFSKWDESEKMKSINVKEYSIFGSQARTPDVMSNTEDSVISEREQEREEEEELVVRTENQ